MVRGHLLPLFVRWLAAPGYVSSKEKIRFGSWIFEEGGSGGGRISGISPFLSEDTGLTSGCLGTCRP